MKRKDQIETIAVLALEDIKRHMELLVPNSICKLTGTWHIANNALAAISRIRRGDKDDNAKTR